MKTINAKLNSVCPIIFHNGQLANPSNDSSQAIKKISGKRKKSEEDFKAMANLEWSGSLYTNAAGDQIMLPAHVIEGALLNAAKKVRLGTQFKSSVFVEKNAKFSYEGPQSIAEIKENPDFRLEALVVINKSRILRTRPTFKKWSAEVEIWYDESLIDPTQVRESLKIAGSQVGLCDWRPKYGRFEVVDITE
jgi:hypothetical protein